MAEPAPFVQPQAYDANGQPIAPEAYGQAVAEGKAFFQKGAKVFARDQRGTLVTLDAAEANHPGYQVLTPAEIEQAHAQKQYGEGVGNVAKATAAGAARGLTLGASDALLSGIGGDDTRKALQGLRQANPVASTVGEIGGALAPLVLSGGGAGAAEGAAAATEGAGALGTAGQAASGAVRALGAGHRAIAGVGSLVEEGAARGLAALGATGETALGRIGIAGAKMAARGAAEGALYGAAQEANDSVLNGDAITAEKIVAGMGHGALFGGVVGGLLGAGTKAVGEGLERLVPKKETLNQIARDQAADAIGLTGPQRAKLAGRAVGEAGQARVDATMDDLLNTKLETGELAGQRVLQPAANVGESLSRISQAKTEAQAKLSGLKDTISEGMAATGHSPDVGEFLRRADEQVFAPALKSNSPGVRSEIRAAQRELSLVRERAAMAMESANPEQAAMSFRELDQFRQDLASRVYPKPPPGGGLPAPPPKGAEQLQKVERILADYLKEEAGTFLAKVGENPNAYNEANRLYSSFNKLEQVANKADQMAQGRRGVSPSDHALGLTSALGALATGNVGALGAMAYGGAAAIANKMVRERGNALIATLARRAAETDNVIDTAAKALAGTGERVKAPVLTTAFEGKSIAEQYERTAERVRELAQPAFAQQHISNLIPDVTAQYPNVGLAVSQKLLGIYQALAAKIPQTHADTGATLTPLAIKTRVSPLQQREFLNAAMGALQPEKVIADLGRGVVNRQAIEMLKTVHPLTFKQLRTQVADVVQHRTKAIPYQRRIMLSTVFDFVGDSSLEPTRFTALQQMTKAMTIQDAAKDAQAAKPTSGSGGGSPGKLTEGMQLPAQAAAGDI